MNSVLEFAGDAWFGRAPLWKVFWLAGELAGTTLAVILFVVIPIGPYSAAALALSVPYLVWIYVSMWRCAYNVRAKQWGDIARIYVVASAPVVCVGAGKIVAAAGTSVGQ